MSDKYFVNCSEMGFETFKTEEEAKEEANNRISLEQDNASEGWHDNVETIVWGKIHQETEMYNERTKEEAEAEGICVSLDCDTVCDYRLRDIK